MKIALLGNCQLQQIGWLLKAFFQSQQLEHEIVWHAPIFSLGDHNAEIVPIFHALEQADVIYGQFHEKRWNTFSTDNLGKYFDIQVVPTLESLVSFPQMNYFTKGPLNLNLYSVDFRMMELYLKGIHVDYVPEVYCQATINDKRRVCSIENTAAKYKSLHQKGKSIFDYSDAYAQAMNEPEDPYFVHNHPNNAQLQWLTNQILLHAGVGTQVSFGNLPEVLTDTIVPTLNRQRNDRYRIRATEVGLATAAKINYAFLSTYERTFLEEELEKSNYKAMCISDV